MLTLIVLTQTILSMWFIFYFQCSNSVVQDINCVERFSYVEEHLSCFRSYVLFVSGTELGMFMHVFDR